MASRSSLPEMKFDPETVGKPRLGRSALLHIGIIAVIVGGNLIYHILPHHEWGNDRTPGAIQATLVSSAPAIPLPQEQPPTPNVVATQTPSPAPAPPLPEIAKEQPPPDAIPLHQIHIQPKKIKPKPEPHTRRNNAPTPPQQHHATYGEQAASNMPRTLAPTNQGPQQPVTVTGGSNGFNYPWYVDIIQRLVRQNWYTQEVSPSTPTGTKVSITFDISRNGVPSNIRISQRSGYPSLDTSALRAAQRVENFGPLPTGYNKSSVSVEYTFTYNLNQH
jgi:protein TonB